VDEVRRKLIMLPGPTNVPDRVTNAMLAPMINHRGQEFAHLLRQLTERTRYLLQTADDVLIL